MIHRFLIAAGCLAIVQVACAQEISLHSEFQRLDPWGRVVRQDLEQNPREVLSPALPRNGHLSVHIVVTAPPGTNYFLYAGANPENILRMQLYREHFVRCGESWCGDWLTPVTPPVFGAIPEGIPELPNQTTRTYLLDIWAPADAIPRRVRVEALIKTGIWDVTPLEVRIVPQSIPAGRTRIAEQIAPLEAPAGATAQIQLLRYMAGLEPTVPPGMVRLRDILQRNAAEDMLLARSLSRSFPELNFFGWRPLLAPVPGGEWYLRVRDFLFRYGY